MLVMHCYCHPERYHYYASAMGDLRSCLFDLKSCLRRELSESETVFGSSLLYCNSLPRVSRPFAIVHHDCHHQQQPEENQDPHLNHQHQHQHHHH